jgi:NADPH-dependent glutamate synthase beta subunit-like oxidoreductase/ferredoxin
VGDPSRAATEVSPLAAPAPPPSFLDGAGGDLPGIRTGLWATQRPHRQRAVPPCNHVCPAGNDVQGFLHALAGERVDEALSILLSASPFPGVCGRVCPAPCTETCNRIGLDGAVNVPALERFAADHGTVALVAPHRRRENVAIVGSGPAGLSAAYHLARLGYGVTVYESGEAPGGLLRTGIPAYRLPAEVVDREVERIVSLGVEVRTGERVDAARLLELARDHDAVLVATGLQGLAGLDLGSTGSDGAVVQGIDFLARARRGRAARLDGETVVVVGGGNTAIDAARTALRLGAAEVVVAYRRTTREMPAIRSELEAALEEGVTFESLTQPVAFHPDAAGLPDGAAGPRHRLTCRAMRLGEPDASGRRRPSEIPGTDFDLPCDRVILALGQSPDRAVFPAGTELGPGGRLADLETPVYALGDLATGDGTVAAAIGAGRRAAFGIHRQLSREPLAPPRAPTDAVASEEVVPPEAMKLHLFERAAPSAVEALAPWRRSWNFAEVHSGLADPGEARRCLSCGVCNDCDRCVTFCPERVLRREGGRLVFDYDHCKGCGVCAAECPRDVVVMSQLG